MDKMKESDDFVRVGEVTIRKFKMIDGKKVYFPYFEKNNLIVEVGRAVLMDLMLGLTRKRLKFIDWGKGGAKMFPEGDPLEEIPPEDKDENIYDYVIRKELNDYNRLSPTSVEFTETLISDEVDSDINEAAMIFEDPQTRETSMFARITFPTLRLFIDKGFGIELQWVFNFKKIRTREECIEEGKE